MSERKKLKVVILGDSAVGKTSLLNSYVNQKFLESDKVTVGADFMEKQVVVDGKIINLEIWDTAGQQRFRSLGGAFYRGADCCVLFYDITDKNSFDNIESWFQQFLKQRAPKEPEKFPFILVGNKIDRSEERQVEQQSVNEFLAKHPKIKHFQTSAKDIKSVSNIFKVIALASVQNKQQTQIKASSKSVIISEELAIVRILETQQEEKSIPFKPPKTRLTNKKRETQTSKGCC